MRLGLRWKLMTSYLLVVLVIAGVLYGYLNHTLENNLVEETRVNLFNQAGLARLIAAREIVELRRDAPQVASLVGRDIRARVTVIARDGEVTGDSDLSRGELSTLDNHGDRPEIIGAMKDGSGSSVRYSATLHTHMLYVALPFSTRSQQQGVVRLALPLSRVEGAMTRLHVMLGASCALALLCALLLSYILSQVTTHPLRTITAAASSIGKGEFGCRIPVTGGDEAAELASVMNEMAARIESQMDRLSTERNRLDTILKGMGEGVMVTDGRGVITLANPSFRALFSLGEFVEGESLIEVTRQPALNNTLQRVLATREEIVEEIVIPAPGEMAVLTHWVPLLENGSMVGVVTVFHDISDIRKLEKVRKDFVANVSHELRTPVAVIKGYAETLMSDGERMDPQRVVHFSRIIHDHAERLAGLIGDLLTLSQLESGRLELHMTPLSLQDLAARVCALLGDGAGRKGISVEQRIGEGIPRVSADPGRVEQVLINLLDNAVKYTPAGGVVTISAEESGEMVRISVSDSGIGIPAADLPRIFERFYRVDAARSRELGGTGLGLSIVKHIVQAHGGTVSVESVPGKGSVFSFTLRKA